MTQGHIGRRRILAGSPWISIKKGPEFLGFVTVARGHRYVHIICVMYIICVIII